MKFSGKELTLADLGEISDKALSAWPHYGFDRSHGWRAFVCGDVSDFIEWLES